MRHATRLRGSEIPGIDSLCTMILGCLSSDIKLLSKLYGTAAVVHAAVFM